MSPPPDLKARSKARNILQSVFKLYGTMYSVPLQHEEPSRVRQGDGWRRPQYYAVSTHWVTSPGVKIYLEKSGTKHDRVRDHIVGCDDWRQLGICVIVQQPLLKPPSASIARRHSWIDPTESVKAVSEQPSRPGPAKSRRHSTSRVSMPEVTTPKLRVTTYPKQSNRSQRLRLMDEPAVPQLYKFPAFSLSLQFAQQWPEQSALACTQKHPLRLPTVELVQIAHVANEIYSAAGSLPRLARGQRLPLRPAMLVHSVSQHGTAFDMHF